MTAHSTPGAVGSGYGALERSTADTTRGSHTHGLPEHLERRRSGNRLAAVGAGMLATTVILGTVLLMTTKVPFGDDADLTLPNLYLATRGRPNELLSLSAPGSDFTHNTQFTHKRLYRPCTHHASTAFTLWLWCQRANCTTV